MTRVCEAPSVSEATIIPLTARSRLRSSTLRGGVWSLLGQAFRFGITMGGLAVLSRRLSPADFGLFSIVGAVTVFLGTFKDLGLSLVVVRERELDQRQVSSVFWINFAAGVGLMLLCFAVTPLVAAGFGDARLAALLSVQALALPVSASGIVHRALLRRRMAFAALTAIDTCGLLLSTTVGLAMAIAGSGVWCLPVMSLVLEMVGAAGLWWCSGWRPGRFCAWKEIRLLLRSGVHLQVVSLCNIGTSSVEKLFVGGACGTLQLGLYTRAQTLLSLPINQIMQPLGNVIIPAFSVLHADPESYRRHFLAGFRLIALGSVALTTIMVCCARPLVAFVLGPQWGPSADIFVCLAISVFEVPLGQAIYWLFVTQGRTADLARQARWNALLYILAIAVGMPYGAIGVALSCSISGLLLRVPLQYRQVHHPDFVTWKDLAVITIPCALLTLVASGVAWVAILALDLRSWHPLPALIASGTVAAGTVALSLVSIPWGRRSVSAGLESLRWMLARKRGSETSQAVEGAAT